MRMDPFDLTANWRALEARFARARLDDLRESDACGHPECADEHGHIDGCQYDFVDDQLEPEGQ